MEFNKYVLIQSFLTSISFKYDMKEYQIYNNGNNFKIFIKAKVKNEKEIYEHFEEFGFNIIKIEKKKNRLFVYEVWISEDSPIFSNCEWYHKPEISFREIRNRQKASLFTMILIILVSINTILMFIKNFIL